jgi:hypothetical protein
LQKQPNVQFEKIISWLGMTKTLIIPKNFFAFDDTPTF